MPNVLRIFRLSYHLLMQSSVLNPYKIVRSCTKCKRSHPFRFFSPAPGGKLSLQCILCSARRSGRAAEPHEHSPEDMERYGAQQTDEDNRRRFSNYSNGRKLSKGSHAIYAKLAEQSSARERAIEERKRRDRLAAAAYRARAAIAGAFSRSGVRKSAKTAEILGCSWEFFRQHIEAQFLPGMTWENRGAWHIDHIVPLAAAETEAEVLSLNHFTNLRPLWAKDNLAKSDKRLFLL